MAQKRRGGQTKEERIRSRIERMEGKLENAILEGNEAVVAHYLEYLAVLDKAARGTLNGVSVTNQISSAKVLIEKAEAILDKEKSKKQEEEEVDDKEEVVPLFALNSSSK